MEMAILNVLVVEDDDMVPWTMNGYPFMAASFATTLRRKLFRGEIHSRLLNN